MGAGEEILKVLARIEAKVDALAATRSSSSSGGVGSSGNVADDRDLDSQYGNPEVHKDPPKWEGDSYAGVRFSDCPPEFLDTLAGFLDWQAGKDEKGSDEKKRKNASYKRRDAARARGWADRIRAGKVQQNVGGVTFGQREPGDDDIPFA